MIKRFSLVLLTVVLGVGTLVAQNNQLRNAVSGQKYKMKGAIIVSKVDESTFIVRDSTNVDTKVVIQPSASIKSSAFLGGDKYAATSLVRGLTMDIEGVGDA